MLSSALKEALLKRGSRKVIVITINPSGVDPSSAKRPLFCDSASYVLSTATGVSLRDPLNGAQIEAKPFVIEWPTISKKVNILERRAEIAQTEVSILADSGLATVLERGAQTATYTIDLWSDGIASTDMYRMMSGRIVDPPTRPRRNSTITLSLIDGDPFLDNPIVGKFTRAEFGDQLPDDVVGIGRNVQIGPVSYRTIATPLDRDGFLFHCFDGEPSEPIEQVEKGGVPLPRSEWDIEVIKNGVTVYTAIRLKNPARNQTVDITDVISFSGGAARTLASNSIEQLLSLSGYRLSDRAISISRSLSRDFPLSILLNEDSATPISILTDRLMGQTNCILTISNGFIDFIPIEFDPPNPPPMALGSNLLYRVPLNESETSIEQVYSQVEILCGRDQYGSSANGAKPIKTIIRSPESGSMKTRRLLARARAINGFDRTLTIEANDLVVELDSQFKPGACPSAETLADVYATAHSSTHNLHAYKATWVDGIYAERGTRWQLTDPDEGIANENCVVVEQLFPDSTGPIITFQTEDAK